MQNTNASLKEGIKNPVRIETNGIAQVDQKRLNGETFAASTGATGIGVMEIETFSIQAI